MSTDKAKHIADLLQSVDAYPHPVEGEIEVIETHISWVILAGDYAYKIKKPIQNSFLDYTTLELRKHFCETELLLNQRFAKELYLGVVAIADYNGRLLIGGAGVPVEFAVKMKRFPGDALLSDRLVHGLVTLDDVRQLAARIAEFHQLAAQAKSSSRFGSPDLVYQEALDNIREIEAAKFDRLSYTLPLLQQWAADHYATHVGKFQSRKMSGHIRECHGDLHLGNIVEWNNELVPFDGIEFCDEFRWIDTLSDAAFVAMDFVAHGRSDFYHSFINAYFEATGDYGSIPVLQWYLVYRAMVRAKVAAIRLSQTASNPHAHSQAEVDVASLVSLAQRLTEADKVRPSLWITHGVSGSGKTTGSEQLVQRHGAIRIRADVERKRLIGLKPNDRFAQGDERVVFLYTDEMTTRTYQRLAELVEEIIRGGRSVIVDASFLMKSQRLLFRELADKLQLPFHILAFHAEPETLRQRVADRMVANQDASDADLAVLESQLQRQQPLDEDELKLTIQ
ncbi:MAG TPA: AAA family ATPase [Pirellula sp.]|nr:AAA family ATPase [Pirellula sp.]